MSNAKANKAIPFALENQLLDDIDLLQFFPIKSIQANTWSVVVIATEIIHKIEQELQQAKCKPVAIVPDFLLLPFNCIYISCYSATINHYSPLRLSPFR